MINEMMQNMLGDYAKYVTRLDNGQVRVNLPKDLNNPSLEDSTPVDLDTNELLSLISMAMQKKQYQVADSVYDVRTITEGDSDFDINKWMHLAVGEIKNKK